MNRTICRPIAHKLFRAYASDGAFVLFRPSSGETVRWVDESVRRFQTFAPRAVFVALSHACNLNCWFCSRDTSIRDRWTAGDMLALLSALSHAGTQEVAFGGGEPLAYAGFLEFLERLAEETPLAIHFTTNGTLIDEVISHRLKEVVGEIRVSIYQSQPWQRAILCLKRAGVRTAANIVVTRENVRGLVPLLQELRELGCSNVALLRYVGPAEEAHLEGSDWVFMEHAIRTAPLTIRLSKCFADRMPTISRAPSTGDCGAGRSFLTIDPNSQFRACSFHHDATDFVDAKDLLMNFRQHAEKLALPAILDGCARTPSRLKQPEGESVHVYSGFASNNSGDTVLVAELQTTKQAFELTERLSGFDAEKDQDAWIRFLSEEGCDTRGIHYDGVVASTGNTLLATGYDSGDALSGLREVVTRRGAQVIHTEVHAHDRTALLLGIARVDKGAQEHLWLAGADEVQRHGGTLFATFSNELNTASNWKEKLQKVEEWGAPVAAELIPAVHGSQLVAGCKTIVAPDAPAYFQAWFYSAEEAQAFAKSLNQKHSTCGSTVLLPVRRFRKRLAIRALEAGGVGLWLPKGELQIGFAFFFSEYPKSVTVEMVKSAMSKTGLGPWSVKKSYHAVSGAHVTAKPLRTLCELQELANHLGSKVHATLAPAQALPRALGRIKQRLNLIK